MKLIAYLSLLASLVALVGFALNPSAVAIRGLTSQPSDAITDYDYLALLFQASSWVAFLGGVTTLIANKDKWQKIIGIIAFGVPLLVVIFRYGPITLGGGV